MIGIDEFSLDFNFFKLRITNNINILYQKFTNDFPNYNVFIKDFTYLDIIYLFIKIIYPREHSDRASKREQKKKKK